MLLLWKGEIFGGMDIASDENDGEVLMRLLGGCKGSVPNALSRIKGPWAIIYWQVTLSGKFQFSLTGICCTVCLAWDTVSEFYMLCMFRKVQEDYGLAEMHLVAGVFLFTGRQGRTLGFCYRQYHLLLQMSVLLVCISGQSFTHLPDFDVKS